MTITEVLALNRDMLAMLEELEDFCPTKMGDGMEKCFFCGCDWTELGGKKGSFQGHQPDCRLAALVKRARGQVTP